jgi:hypothetical protein
MLLAVSTTSALGINCRGSVNCNTNGFVSNTLAGYLQGIDENRFFDNGAQ